VGGVNPQAPPPLCSRRRDTAPNGRPRSSTPLMSHPRPHHLPPKGPGKRPNWRQKARGHPGCHPRLPRAPRVLTAAPFAGSAAGTAANRQTAPAGTTAHRPDAHPDAHPAPAPFLTQRRPGRPHRRPSAADVDHGATATPPQQVQPPRGPGRRPRTAATAQATTTRRHRRRSPAHAAAQPPAAGPAHSAQRCQADVDDIP